MAPRKKIQREVTSHVYMGLPNTISSPFPEMGTSPLAGGVGRKGFAASDCPGLAPHHTDTIFMLLSPFWIIASYLLITQAAIMSHGFLTELPLLPLTSKGKFLCYCHLEPSPISLS